jgi:hypothetical protein
MNTMLSLSNVKGYIIKLSALLSYQHNPILFAWQWWHRDNGGTDNNDDEEPRSVLNIHHMRNKPIRLSNPRKSGVPHSNWPHGNNMSRALPTGHSNFSDANRGSWNVSHPPADASRAFGGSHGRSSHTTNDEATNESHNNSHAPVSQSCVPGGSCGQSSHTTNDKAARGSWNVSSSCWRVACFWWWFWLHLIRQHIFLIW